MQSAPSEIVETHLQSVVPVKYDDQLCYPFFKYIHLNTPNRDQLKKDLARYRQKEIMIQLCNNADNYSSTYEELHSKFFAEQKEDIRMIWEYVNMMYQDYDGEDFLKIEASQLDNFKRLSEFMGNSVHCRWKKKKQSLVFSDSIWDLIIFMKNAINWN